MGELLGRILVVGSRAAFGQLFNSLEGTGRYHFNYATGPETVFSTAPIFNAVLLHVPEEKSSAEAALLWLEKVGRRVPVVVISTREDTKSYMAAMQRGAFDYLTCYTPVAEVTRILGDALQWHRFDLPLAASA